ncbi:MAG: hypothetical protein QNI84_03940 [Henriciella sp.]|nr:hypothetical protein [Henriciella sp.]
MHWSLFALAALALIAAHSLKLPYAAKGRLSALTFFAVGLVSSAVLIKGLAHANGIGRTTDFDKFVNAATLTAQQDPAPLIVFTGASYSRNGIDPERLTLALKERGYNYRVVSLSIEAASILERDAHLNQFMDAIGRAPTVVFVEVSQGFDDKVAYMFGNSKFSQRAIEQFDLRTTAWSLLGLSNRACENTSECVKDTAFLGLHSALNFVSIGLLGKSEMARDAEAIPAYDPQFEPRETVDPTEALERADIVPVEGKQWIRSYRYQQRKRLLAEGVAHVAYYQPPLLDQAERAYTEGLCRGELIALPCIHANDPDLMASLNGVHWFDRGHLLDSGTAIYNAWLVDQMIASGILEPGA